MNGPCLNCNKRHLGCHSTCEDYISFRKERDKYNEKVRNDKYISKMVSDINYERSKRRRRR